MTEIKILWVALGIIELLYAYFFYKQEQFRGAFNPIYFNSYVCTALAVIFIYLGIS